MTQNQPPARKLASPLYRGAAVLLTLVACAASAAEVAGVRLEDKTQVESRDLVLNGAGLRKRVVFNVYVIGLYGPTLPVGWNWSGNNISRMTVNQR